MTRGPDSGAASAETGVRPGGDASGRFDTRSILLGLESGLIATVVMTVFRMPISRSPPPTARFWAQYVAGGEPEDHALVGLVLHLGYGSAAGALFGILSPRSEDSPEVETEARGVLRGLAYALALSAFGDRFLVEGLLGQDLEPDERLVFHLGHVVYGLTLGAWLGSNAE